MTEDKETLNYSVGNANGRGLIRIEVEGTGEHIASMPRGAISEDWARRLVDAFNSLPNEIAKRQEAERAFEICKAQMVLALKGEVEAQSQADAQFKKDTNERLRLHEAKLATEDQLAAIYADKRALVDWITEHGEHPRTCRFHVRTSGGAECSCGLSNLKGAE